MDAGAEFLGELLDPEVAFSEQPPEREPSLVQLYLEVVDLICGGVQTLQFYLEINK